MRFQIKKGIHVMIANDIRATISPLNDVDCSLVTLLSATLHCLLVLLYSMNT